MAPTPTITTITPPQDLLTQIITEQTAITPEVVTTASGQPLSRADQVFALIRDIKEQTVDAVFQLAALLAEVRANNFYILQGYENFGTWVEQGSGLDISERHAFDLLSIHNKAMFLGIPTEELKQVKISLLKIIFSLDPATHANEIRALVQDGPNTSLEAVKAKVREIKNPLNPTQGAPKFMTLKLEEQVYELGQKAIELARKNYGDVMKNGEAADISVSQAMEYIFQSYLQDPNNYPEQVPEVQTLNSMLIPVEEDAA